MGDRQSVMLRILADLYCCGGGQMAGCFGANTYAGGKKGPAFLGGGGGGERVVMGLLRL